METELKETEETNLLKKDIEQTKYYLAKIHYPDSNDALLKLLKQNGTLIDTKSHDEIKKNGHILYDGALIYVKQDYTPILHNKIYHTAGRYFCFSENFLKIIKEITKEEYEEKNKKGNK